MVLVVEPSHELWFVANAASLRGKEGRHVRVTGRFDGRTRTIEVSSSRVVQEENRMEDGISDADFVAFVATARPNDARNFYVDTLGLEFLADEPQALVLRGNGRYLRLQKVRAVPKPVGTALGWIVEDIVSKARELSRKGVSFERYEGLPQDENGIATFANGVQVAWFVDPDGNILSLTELAPKDD